MNKKLIALAVAGAVAAPLAAQADVTIYGKMHMSVDWYMDSVPEGQSLVNPEDDSGLSVSSNFSRIGFKGSEDLGSGLKAIWQVESQFNLDEGNSPDVASRNSFLGLASDFGTIVFGRHDSPVKDIGRKLDIFGDTIGDIRALTDLSGGGSPGFDERINNVIGYISPSFAGLKVFAAYSADTAPAASGNADNNDFDAWSGSLSYENGPLFAAVGYEFHSAAVLPAGEDLNEHIWRGGLGATFAGFKVGGLYQHTNSDFNPVADGRNVYGLFAQYAFGTTSIGAQWTHANDSDDIDNSGGDLWSVGLFHNLSKRTQVYAMYARINEDDNSAFLIGGGGGHGDTYIPSFDTNGEANDPSAVSIGLVHSF